MSIDGGSTSVESGAQNPLRQEFKDYLAPTASRKGAAARRISSLIINDQNRAVFAEELTGTVKSSKDGEELRSVMSLAFDPHQDRELRRHLESKILAAKPELNSALRYGGATSHIALNSEYDNVRKAVGEKLQELGLTNVKGYDLEYIFTVIHPSPYAGEGQGKHLRSSSELMDELLAAGQSRALKSG